tara:strand:+ start:6390 stop:9458 length:3069 start_codon:yes stop_codon:yes gene_type:complete
MKPPFSNMGGGYRRKADQDTLGRNSRLRYSTYVPFDKRMMPLSNARIYANSNKIVGSRQNTGNSLGGTAVPSLVSWTPTAVTTVNLDTWRYVVNWQIQNPAITPISYTVKAKTSNNTLITFGTTYTASQSATSTETAQSIDIVNGLPVPDIAQPGQNTFQIQFINNADNSIIFTYTTPAVNLYDFSNISQTVANSTVTGSAAGTLNAAFEFTNTVISNSNPQVLSMVFYHRLVGSTGGFSLVGAPQYVNGQSTAPPNSIYVTIPNSGQQVTTTFSRAFTPTQSGNQYEVYAVVRFDPNQQPNLANPSLYNFFAVQLPTVTVTVPAITGAIFANGGDLIEQAGARSMFLSIATLTGASTDAIYNVKYELEIDNVVQYISPILANFTNVTASYIIQNFLNQNLHVTGHDTIFLKRRLRFTIQDGFNSDFVSAWSNPFTYSPKIELTGFNHSIIYQATGLQPNNQLTTVFDATTGSSSNARLALALNNLVQTGATENSEPFYLKVKFRDQGSVDQEFNFTQNTDFNTIQSQIVDSSASPGLSVGLVEDETLTNFVILIDPVNWPAGVPKLVGYGYDGLWDKTMTDLTTFRIDSFTSSFTSSAPHTTYNLTISSFAGARLSEVGENLGFDTTYTVLRNGASAVVVSGPTTGSTVGQPATPAINPNITPYNPTFLQNISRVVEIEGPVRVSANTNLFYRSFLLANYASQFYLPPKVTGFTSDVANATMTSYDVRLTGFTGFTAFINNENKDYTFDVIFKDGATTLHTKTVTWNTVTNATLPHVLCTTDRTGTDASWWTSPAGTHTIDIVLKYNFSDGTLNINQLYTLQSLPSSLTVTYPVLVTYPQKLWSLGDHVTLPFSSSSNQTYTATTGILPSETYPFRITMDLTALHSTGLAHNTILLIGHSSLYNQATYWGMRVGRQGNDLLMFYYPNGTNNMFNPGGSPFYHNPMTTGDTAQIVYEYNSATLVSTLSLSINGNAVSINNPTHQHTSGWLQYNPSATSLFYALGHGIANTQWDNVLVERLGP